MNAQNAPPLAGLPDTRPRAYEAAHRALARRAAAESIVLLQNEGAILPLVFGTVPFYTRQVEVALAGVNEGKVEAARSMGSGTLGLIFRVYLHEAVPELIRVTTVTAISLIGLTTMAGAVGAGGIGSFAINYGQNQNHQDIVNVCVVVLLIVVFVLQSLGNALARRTTNRGLFRKVHK